MGVIRGLIVVCIVTVLLLFVSTTAFSQAPSFLGVDGGSPPLRLGKGFVQGDLMRVPVEDCHSYTVKDASNGGATNMNVDILATSSAESLLQAMEVDMEASYHNLAASMDAKFAYSRQVASEERNISVVVRAAADYPNRAIADATMKPQYRQMIAEGDIDGFVLRCGSRIPTVEKRGVRLNAIITIREASSATRNKITASMSGSYGYGPMGADAKANFDQELKQAVESKRVEVKVFARGGDPAQGIAGILEATLKGKSSLDDIGAALSTFARTLTADKAAALGYWVSDIPELADAQRDPWSRERQERLRILFERYSALSERLSRINAILNKTDSRHVIYSAASMAMFATTAGRHDVATRDIVAAHAACRRSVAPALDACMSEPASVAVALAEFVPDPMRQAGATWVLALREGASDKNTDLSPWKLIRQADADAVFASPVANHVVGRGRVFDDYIEGLKQRIRSARPSARRFQAGVVVYGEDVLGVELVGELDARTAVDTPAGNRRLALKGWGTADMQPERVGSWFDMSETGQQSEDVFLRLHFDYMQSPPPCPGICMPFGGRTTRQEEWFANYDESAALHHMDVDLGAVVHLPVVAKIWIRAGIDKGHGRLSLSIRDRYTSTPVSFPLYELHWQHEPTLKRYKVTYRASTGEPPNEFYVTESEIDAMR